MKNNESTSKTSAPGTNLVRHYDPDFIPTDAYRASMPDIQNSDAREILGANVPILKVGISNFRLPLHYTSVNGERRTLETSVTGTVSLQAGRKGINMSRIMRVFYSFQERMFTPDLLQEILSQYRSELEAHSAQLKLDFEYPMIKTSLRSGLQGWQYYKCAFEGKLNQGVRFQKFIHFDFIYSSACPCSSNLAEHARESRNVYSISHSQRSTARVSVEIADGAQLSIEEIQQICLDALKTETQVMVKRVDEQAFAEMNGTYTKFVEDAARLLYEKLQAEPRIADFQVACAHLESLHSHDAVAVITKGIRGASGESLMILKA